MTHYLTRQHSWDKDKYCIYGDPDNQMPLISGMSKTLASNLAVLLSLDTDEMSFNDDCKIFVKMIQKELQ